MGSCTCQLTSSSGLRCPYLEVSNAAGVKAFYFDDDDATGIEMADSQSSMLNAPIYNMAGQRLQKMQKGINIVGGKKILR